MNTEEQLQELLILQEKIRCLEVEYENKKNTYLLHLWAKIGNELRLQEIEKKRKVIENVAIAHRNLNEVLISFK
jgi:hypothetical protein